MAGADHPFYPDTQDLINDVWLKVLQPGAQKKIEKIWSDPNPKQGGFLGISRLVSVICTNAMIDGKRYRDTRAPEILAIKLDAPVTVSHAAQGLQEDAGTQADLVSDETDQPQAFRLEDLQVEMTASEFAVLESIVNGANITDIAEERGESRSHVGRIAVSAKANAKQWIEWLRQCSYQEAREHITYTFEKKPCLRPDRIAKATVDHWNDSLRIVPFHDPAREWYPRITSQPYVRAKRECYNKACRSGFAIGPNNLVLPAAQRHEAVRFLPARTKKANTLCSGCADAQQANAKLFVREERCVAAFFMGEQAPQQLGQSMDHHEATEIIKKHNIPRSTVARLSRMYLSDLSGWLNGRTDISQDKIERITQVIADIAKVIESFPMKVDLRDPENVRKMIVMVNDAWLQMALFNEDAAEDTAQDLPITDLRIRAVDTPA